MTSPFPPSLGTNVHVKTGVRRGRRIQYRCLGVLHTGNLKIRLLSLCCYFLPIKLVVLLVYLVDGSSTLCVPWTPTWPDETRHEGGPDAMLTLPGALACTHGCHMPGFVSGMLTWRMSSTAHCPDGCARLAAARPLAYRVRPSNLGVAWVQRPQIRPPRSSATRLALKVT